MLPGAPPIRIAIVGGGLAGAALANALIRNPRLQVQVFESAPQFSERGAAVGLTTVALKVLDQVVSSAEEMLDRAGAVTMNSTVLMLGSGPQAGTKVDEFTVTENGPRSKRVHRASLLRELLAPLPPSILHANKKLTTLASTQDDSIDVTFQDGTVQTFDAVIGADGIFSTVRKYVLGDDAEAHTATPAGFWDCRTLVSMAEAKAALGGELFLVDRQYGWCGEGGFMMHDVLENGEMVQCVISGAETASTEDRKRDLSRGDLEGAFAEWLDGPVAKGMIDLLLKNTDLAAYSQWEHKSTPRYNNGRVCVIGDAAHASTPWQGSGAGFAIEDVMILSTLFGAVSSPSEIDAALRAFDAVRRERGQRLVDSSRGTGLIMCGRDEVGVDLDKMKEALGSRWDFIFGLDVEGHKREALGKFEEFTGVR